MSQINYYYVTIVIINNHYYKFTTYIFILLSKLQKYTFVTAEFLDYSFST